MKYEDIYLRDYANGLELGSGLGRYFRYYNFERPHQSLAYRTPVEFAAEARLALSLSGDAGVSKDKAEPNQPCLTVYPPTSALGSLPSVALSSGRAKEQQHEISTVRNASGKSVQKARLLPP